MYDLVIGEIPAGCFILVESRLTFVSLFLCWDTDHYVPSRNQVIKTSFYRQTDRAASHYLAQKYLCKVTKWKISIWHHSLHKVASLKIAMNSMHYVSVSIRWFRDYSCGLVRLKFGLTNLPLHLNGPLHPYTIFNWSWRCWIFQESLINSHS